MNNIKKEEIIIDISRFIKLEQESQESNDILLLAKNIYEKYIEPLDAKLTKRENKYSDSMLRLQQGFNNMLNLSSQYIYETIKEKDERIEYLEQTIKELIEEKERQGDA